MATTKSIFFRAYAPIFVIWESNDTTSSPAHPGMFELN